MLKIRPLELNESELNALKQFTDREIGFNYYSPAELISVGERSLRAGVMHSLVLVDGDDDDDDDAIQGIRIVYPPGNWQTGKGQGLSPELWPHGRDETAYFQSIFLAASLQGQGWGGRLSLAALEILRTSGARGVVCHSWKESPNNSSFRYLDKLGFKALTEYPNYWAQIPYDCARCKTPPCLCTAQEMYFDLDPLSDERKKPLADGVEK